MERHAGKHGKAQTNKNNHNSKHNLKRKCSFSSNNSYEQKSRKPVKHENKKPRLVSEKGHRSKENPVEYNEDCISYFENAFKTLKQGIPNDQKDIFIQNVLEQAAGQELQLSRQSIGSRLIELLLEHSNDISILLRFMRSLAEDKEDACGNKFASHVTENLLYHGLCHLQDWSDDVNSEVQTGDTECKGAQLVELMSWIHSLGEFCHSNLQTCLEDEYGCHVLRTLIQVLGGYYMGESGINRSKKGWKQKQQFEEEYLGENFVSKRKKTLVLKEIPKFFVDVLKKMSYSFLALENLETFVIGGHTSPVFQSHLLVLKKRLPKHSRKFNNAVMNILFEKHDDNGIPQAITDDRCSYVVEKLFSCCNEVHQVMLWEKYFCNNLEQIISHRVANFVLQRLFEIVEDKNLFEMMCTATLELFPAIHATRHFGIFVSMSSACKRLGKQQGQFLTKLMQCLQCKEPEERQKMVLPLVMSLQTFDSYQSTDGNGPTIVLQGSLVAQNIFKFVKPIKFVRSLLNMKPDALKYMACHTQGCHILTAFFQSETVGEKSKDKCLNLIKPVLVPLVSDRNGSHTMARLWVSLSFRQRAALAQEIAKNEKAIGSNSNGSVLVKKFRIYHFKNKREEWEVFQRELTRPRTETN